MSGGGGQVQRMSKSDKEKQVKDLWKNYLSWNRDIELRRDRDISSEKARMAGMGMERDSDMWNERIEAVNAELDKEKEKLREGATMKSLRDYYAGEDARTFEAGVVPDAKEALRKEFQAQNNLEQVSDGTRGGGTRLGRRDKRGGVSFGQGRLSLEQQQNQFVNGSSLPNPQDEESRLDKKIEEIAGGDIESSMMQFYENKFGTDLSEDPNKLSEAEKSRKKAEEAAKGGTSSGRSRNAGSMSPSKKGKNPWI